MKRRVYSRSVIVLIVLALAVGLLATLGGSPTGAAKVNNDIGLGTPAALNQPNCDKTTGRWKVQYYAIGPCTRPFAKGEDNGGATAQGVTKDSILVVALIPPAAGDLSPQNGGIKNQATGANGRSENATYDDDALLSSVYNLWGRTIKYEFVTSTGSDEAAQRADAIAVLQKKPFGVIDLASLAPAGQNGGGQIFDAAIAAGKVPANPTPLTVAQTYAPYEAITGEFVAKNASTGNAIYAGDALKNTKRKIGIIYPSGTLGVDPQDFVKAYDKYGGPKIDSANIVAFTVPDDASQLSAQVQSQAPTLIAKLKSAGVTTIVHLGIGPTQTTAFTQAATSNDYFPEWVEAGNGYIDLDFFARNFDAKQWAHAFGPVWFTPTVNGGSADTITTWFQWYWGKNQGTHSPGVLALHPSHLRRCRARRPDAHHQDLQRRAAEVPARRRRVLGHDHEPRVELGHSRAHATHRDGHRLVEPQRVRPVEPGPDQRPGQVHVPRRRQALRDREVPEGREALRHDELDRDP